MAKRISDNTRLKHRYFQYLKEAEGRDEASVDTVAKSIARFEAYTKGRDFRAFRIEQATGFKRQLSEQPNARTGDPLSKATVHATLAHLRRFFIWLADQPGYRSKIRITDTAYFKPSEKDARIATARREPRYPTLEQVTHVVALMPTNTVVERRNQALIAFTLLTGARDTAIASAKLKHVDLATGCFHQDARDVRTKFAKTFDTYFLPVGDDIRSIVEDWVQWLRSELLWGRDDPVFPPTLIAAEANRRYAVIGLARENWKSTGPIRGIFRQAFESAGLEYFHPHSFRHTLAHLGETACTTVEEFKAWSQNLGHESVMTTLRSYGSVSNRRQSEIMRDMRARAKTS